MATLGGGEPILDNKISPNYATYVYSSCVLLVFSTAAVTLRFLSRKLKSEYGKDDWLILAALLLSYAFLSIEFVNATIGHAGYHQDRFTREQLEANLMIMLCYIILYFIGITLARLSVLTFYNRIFPVRFIRISVWILCSVSVAFLVTVLFAYIFAFDPIEAQWKFWLPSKSINVKAYIQSTAIIGLFLDAIILGLPQKWIWSLQLSRKHRMAVSFLLLIGLFTSITSGIRTAALGRLDLSDIPYTAIDPNMWTGIELNLAIICSCAPTFPAILKHWYEHGTSRVLRTPSQNSNVCPPSPTARYRKRFTQWNIDIDNDSHYDVHGVIEKPGSVVHVRHDVEVCEVQRTMSTESVKHKSITMFRP